MPGTGIVKKCYVIICVVLRIIITSGYFCIVLFPTKPLPIPLSGSQRLTCQGVFLKWIAHDLISCVCPSLTLHPLIEKLMLWNIQDLVLINMPLVFPEAALSQLSSYLFL